MLAGFLSGLLGALIFATAHAIVIVPIWDRLGSGPLFGAITGTIAGWALAEIYPSYVNVAVGKAAVIGVRFGALLWLLVAPVTAADALLRALGIAPRLELVAVVVAVILAIGAGASFGWYHTRRWRGMVAVAAATLALTIAMAGPVPVGRSPRAFGIFLAVLPAAAVSGGALALFARWLHHLRASRRLA